MSPVEAVAWIIAGFAIGTYAGAIGAGGGFLVTPALLLRFDEAAPAQVTAASLAVVAVTAVTATLLAQREGRIDRRLAMGMMVLMVPAGLLGAATTAFVPRAPFALGFGILLMALAAYLIWRPVAGIRTPVKRAWRRDLTDRDGNRYAYHIPVMRSLAPNVSVGFFSSLAGIGGGPLGVPMMTYVMHVPHAVAIPTMHFLIVAQAGAAVGLHVVAGNIGAPMTVVPWLAAGVILAAPAGRLLRRKVGEGRLMQALAVGLFVAAARTVAEGIG